MSATATNIRPGPNGRRGVGTIVTVLGSGSVISLCGLHQECRLIYVNFALVAILYAHYLSRGWPSGVCTNVTFIRCILISEHSLQPAYLWFPPKSSPSRISL